MKTVIKSKDIQRLRYPVPKGLVAAAGALKGKFPDAVAYQRKLRKAWDARLKKQGIK